MELLLLSLPADSGCAVLGATLAGLDAVTAVGWPTARGTRLIPDDAAWISRVDQVREGLRRVRRSDAGPQRPGALLDAVGGDVAAIGTVLLLSAVARRTPVLLDGPSALACAALATRCCPAAAGWWQIAAAGEEPWVASLLAATAPPLTQLGLAADDGTGARIGLSVLEAAASLLTAA